MLTAGRNGGLVLCGKGVLGEGRTTASFVTRAAGVAELGDCTLGFPLLKKCQIMFFFSLVIVRVRWRDNRYRSRCRFFSQVSFSIR